MPVARAHSFATFAAVLALFAPVALGAPVAFVADVRGEARAANGVKLGMLAALESSTPITLGKDASAVLIYTSSGAEFLLKGPGEFLVDAEEVKAARGSPPTRREAASKPSPVLVQRNAEAVTASVRMRSVPLQKAPRPALLYPQGPIATLQPTFTWDAQGGTSGFAVIILGPDGKEVGRAMSKGPSVKAPARLAAGTRHSWMLSSDAGTLGTSTFETLPAEAVQRAEASRSRAKAFPDRVLHAYVLQELGAAQDARQAWAALARERPDLPELAVLAR